MIKKLPILETSLEVARLRLCAPNAGGVGSIPGRGTKILYATWRGQKKKKKFFYRLFLAFIHLVKGFKVFKSVEAAEIYSKLRDSDENVNEIDPMKCKAQGVWVMERMVGSPGQQEQLEMRGHLTKQGYPVENPRSEGTSNTVVSPEIKDTGKGFPGGAAVENLSANAGDMGSSPGLGRSHMPRSD